MFDVDVLETFFGHSLSGSGEFADRGNVGVQLANVEHGFLEGYLGVFSWFINLKNLSDGFVSFSLVLCVLLHVVGTDLFALNFSDMLLDKLRLNNLSTHALQCINEYECLEAIMAGDLE